MGQSLADLEKIMRDSLVEFEGRGVTDADVTRVKMNIVSGMIYSLESVAGKVSQLASHQIYTGNPDYTAEDIARYDNVTKDDVMRVYRKYIVDKSAVVMSIVPHGQAEQIAAPDTWSRYERNLPDYTATTDSELEYRRAVDDFDRGIVPPAGENPSITLPQIWRGEFDNGIRVLGAVNDETPTTAISLRIEVGQRNESVDQLGLAALTAAMMNEATQKSTNEDLSDRLQQLGSTIQFAAGNNNTVMSIRSLSKNLDPTLAIAAEKLLEPKFDEADFERVKAQTLQAIEQSAKQASATAAVVYQQLLLGKDNSISYLDIGTAETVSELTLEDVKAFHAAHYSPRITSIIGVSDYPESELLEKLSIFESWQGPDVEETSLESFPQTGATKIYLVDKPGAAQSEIRIGKRALNYDATGEFYQAGLMNFALGGAFNSRINLNLREDKGYSYGARTGFNGEKDYGVFTAQAAVRTDATAASIIEFEQEIRNYAEKGLTEPEMTFTRSAIGQRDARAFETPAQKLVFLSRIVTYDLDDDFVEKQNKILAGIAQTDLSQLAAKHLSMDEMLIVVVGDKETILPSLEELGYEIVELDAKGNRI
jgi:zinc protease